MRAKIERARGWVLDHLPPGVVERPAEWFLSILCIVSGIGSLFGPVEQASLDALLPAVVHRGWNVALILGGTAMLSGLSSIRYIPGLQRGAGFYVITRVPGYRLGCRLLGLASYVYAGALLVVNQWEAFFPSMIVLTFGLVFTVRLLTLKGRDA